MFSLKRLLFLFMLFSIPLFCGVVSAQNSFRPFKPYQPEEFGGARHSGNGFTFDISGIVWTVKPFGCPIGARDATGRTMVRPVYDGIKQSYQTSTLNTAAVGNGFEFGTCYEFGYMNDHSGFLFRGYGISGLGGGFETRDIGSLTPSETVFSGTNSGVFGSIVIDDSNATMPVNIAAATGLDVGNNMIWSVKDGGGWIQAKSLEYLSPLYGWIPEIIPDDGSSSSSSSDEDDDESTETDMATWAPLPLNFAYVQFSNSIDIINLELMYDYRPYPTKWGEIDLYAGARYLDVRDTFSFTGISYGNPIAVIQGGSSGDDTTDAADTSISTDDDSDDSDDSTTAEDEEREAAMDYVNLTTSFKGKVKNQITGPQIGARLQRRIGRWTCSAEGRLLAGINKQTSIVSGKFATQFLDAGSSSTESSGHIAPYNTIAFYNSPQAFYHRSTRDVFSPAFELRLNVRWQWTDAVGLHVGFNSTTIDNIGRGADIIDYKFNSNGSLFGIRKSNTTLTTYGVNFGISVRR